MQPSSNSSNRMLALALIAIVAIVAVTASYVAFAMNAQDPNVESQEDSNGMTGAFITYEGTFVLPEYDVGGAVIALVICLGTFAIYRKRKK